MTPSKVRLIQIAAAYLAYIFGKLGCKIRIQGVSCANAVMILRVDTDVFTLGIMLATNGDVMPVKVLLIQSATAYLAYNPGKLGCKICIQPRAADLEERSRNI